MTVFWTAEARQDRKYIREFIAQANPAAALALDQTFSEKARNLIAHPRLGRPGRIAETRELIVHSNYLLIYDVAGEDVRILRVLHARRQWPPRDAGI